MVDADHRADAAPGPLFDDPAEVQRTLEEQTGHRDIALYLRDPTCWCRAPYALLVDPSLTYRLELHRYQPADACR